MKMPFLLTTEDTEVSRSTRGYVANLRVLRVFSVNSVVKNTRKTTNLSPFRVHTGIAEVMDDVPMGQMLTCNDYVDCSVYIGFIA